MNEPKLRFPEFTGEWEVKKLGEVCETITAPQKMMSKDYLLSGKYPIVDQSQSLICGWTNDESGLMQTPPYIIFGDHTCALKYIDFPFIQGADGVKILSSKKGFIPQFIYQTFVSNPVKQDGYKRHFSEFKEKLYFFPPSPAEQEKIASCLSAMDDLIAAQADKVEALKEKKTGLMQQLFPQPGETTPRLRFPEFTEEWEVKKLGEVCDSILVGFPFKGEDITDDASGHPILRAFSIGEGIIRHGKDYDKYYPYDAEKLKKYEVRKGDIVISMDGSVGKNIAMVSEKEERNLLIQRVARLRITNYPIHLIFQQIISQRFKDYAAGEKKGAVIAHISQKQIELFPIYVPDSPAEQEKIAYCLSALDDQIAAEMEKLTALKDYKKGLMQQLFPQPAK